jgi:hypothetical protein
MGKDVQGEGLKGQEAGMSSGAPVKEAITRKAGEPV